jgi:hypothetical protein
MNLLKNKSNKLVFISYRDQSKGKGPLVGTKNTEKLREK